MIGIYFSDGEILCAYKDRDFIGRELSINKEFSTFQIDEEDSRNFKTIQDLLEMRWKHPELEGEPVYTYIDEELLKDGVSVTVYENTEKAAIREKYLAAKASLASMQSISLPNSTAAEVMATVGLIAKTIQGTTDPDRPGLAEILDDLLEYIKKNIAISE